MFSDLPREVKIMDFSFNTEFLDDPVSKLINFNSVCGTIFDGKLNPQADGCLMILNGKCTSVVWNKKNFFLFDSHSRNRNCTTCPVSFTIFLKTNSIINYFIYNRFQ